MTAINDLRRDLAAGRKRLLAAISGVSEEQFKRRPPATESEARPWSIAEVLGHLLQQEILLSQRMALALSDDGASVPPFSQEEYDGGAEAGRVAPVPQLIHGLLASRREIDRLLEEAASLPDGLERAITYPRLGRLTVGQMLRDDAIGHEVEHVAQILAIREALGAPAAQGASA